MTKTNGFFRRALPNLLLVILSLGFFLFILELTLRFELIDRLYRSRFYEVKGYEFQYQVNLNSDFFRDDEFQLKKGEGTIRIFLIGDSYVFGTGVDQNETIDKQLERRL